MAATAIDLQHYASLNDAETGANRLAGAELNPVCRVALQRMLDV